MVSPVLFSLYTSDCVNLSPNCSLIKYADDTVISGYLNNDSTEYISAVKKFVDWCERHHLVLNVKKTKEMIFDFRRSGSRSEVSKSNPWKITSSS